MIETMLYPAIMRTYLINIRTRIRSQKAQWAAIIPMVHRSFVAFLVIEVMLSMLTTLALAPDLMLGRLDFSRWQDFDRNYTLGFSFISDFLAGGISIFNIFNMQSNAYYHMFAGYWDLHNLTIATFFKLTNPLVGYSPAGYQITYTWLYVGITLTIQTVGLSLLLRLFVKSQVVVVITVLFVNSVLIFFKYTTFNTTNIMPFVPLGIFLLLRFYNTFDVRYLFQWIALMAILVLSNPYHSLSILFTVFHSLMLTFGVAFVIQNGKRHRLQTLRRTLTLRNSVWIAPALLLLTTTVLIYFEMNSAIDLDIGRLDVIKADPFGYYFVGEHFGGSLRNFVYNSIVFWQPEFIFDFGFIGLAVPFLVLITLVLRRNSTHLMLVGSYLWILWMNGPRDSLFPPTFVPHLVNVLTNPFAFTLRSIHFTFVFIAPFLLVPAIAVGLDELLVRIRERKPIWPIVRVGALVVMIFVAGAMLKGIRGIESNWIWAPSALLAVLVVFMIGHAKRPKLAYAGLFGMLILDAVLASVLIGRFHDELKPSYPSIDGQSYDSRALTPFMNPAPFNVGTRSVVRTDAYIGTNSQRHQNLVFQFVDLVKHAEYEPSLYSSRPIALRELSTSSIEGFSDGSALLSVGETTLESNPLTTIIELDTSNAELMETHLGVRIWSIPVEANLLRNFKTNSYIPRDAIILVLNTQRFVPVQGKLRTVGTFDLGNQSQHAISVAVDTNIDLRGVDAHVELSWLGNVIWTNVERMSGDYLKFSVQSLTGGDATLLVPFDERHEVKVDGVFQELNRSPEGFTLFHLTKGSHIIEVKYLDRWHLSELILVALIVAGATAMVLIVSSIKDVPADTI
jgi:hypothetical protein